MTGSEHVASAGYTFKEAKALIGPLVGWPMEDVAAFVVVTLDKESRAGFGASPNVPPDRVPELLRKMAAGIELELRRATS